MVFVSHCVCAVSGLRFSLIAFVLCVLFVSRCVFAVSGLRFSLINHFGVDLVWESHFGVELQIAIAHFSC